MACPDDPSKNQTRNRAKRGKGRPDKTVVTAMLKEERTQILILLNERTASRAEISSELNLSLDKVKYELKVLMDTEPPLVEVAFEKPVRGTVEKFYRARKKAYLSPDEWMGIPDSLKSTMRGPLLSLLVEDAVAAVDRGTFDSVEDAHMSWIPMLLDEQGWRELSGLLYETMVKACEIKEQSGARLAAANASGTSCTVSILGYASANTPRKVGPPVAADTAEDNAPTDTTKSEPRKTKPRPKAKDTKKASRRQKGK